VPTQLATPLGKEEEKHTMNTDHNYPSDVNSDNAVTLDDLSEGDRQKIERELKEWEAEFLKRYFKTSNGLVKKVTAPSTSPVFDTQVNTSTLEKAHSVGVSIDTKYVSDIKNTSHTFTQEFTSRVDELKERLTRDIENILHQHVQSVVRDKQLMPLESSTYTKSPTNMHNPGASDNITQFDVPVNQNQDGQNCTFNSANKLISSVAPAIVLTSVPQNLSTNN
jgi:hypothetical protein